MEKKLNEKLGYGSVSSYRLNSLNDNHAETRSDTTTSSSCEPLHDISSKLSDTGCSYHNSSENNGGGTATTNGCYATSNNYTDNEVLSYIPDENAADFTGFENPSFVHLNETEIVVMRENAFPNEVDAYNHNHSEVITLKCAATRISNQRLDEIERAESPLQRFSSFRSETPTLFSSQNNSFSSFGSTDSASAAPQTQSLITYQATTTTSRLRHSNSLLEDKLKIKPAANPRPASLSGLFYFFFVS